MSCPWISRFVRDELQDGISAAALDLGGGVKLSDATAQFIQDKQQGFTIMFCGALPGHRQWQWQRIDIRYTQA